MTWHIERDDLAAYARGEIDHARAFSVEAHLVSCAECRADAAALVAPERHERVWAEVADRVDRPRRTVVEVVLARAGVPAHVARLLAATPSLTASWLTAVALALAFSVTGAHLSSRGVVLFLVLAPLLPLAGVAAAYAPGVDPTFEIGIVAPMRTFRLLLLRAAAVLATTTLLAGVAALALPVLDWTAAAWLVPSLALTLCSLALATRVAPEWAFGSVALLWVAGVALSAAWGDDRLAAFGAAPQVALAVVACMSALVLERRREAFEFGGAA